MLLLLVGTLVSIVEVGTICRESATTVSGTSSPGSPICSGDLIFEDNFDIFDKNVWHYELTRGNVRSQEFQWYSDDHHNGYVENGILNIKPSLTADEYGNDFLYCGILDIKNCTGPSKDYCCKKGSNDSIINPIKSIRIRTKDTFAFKYGKVEVRAKLPVGDWLFPAIWMMPQMSKYSSWPVSGEIDILEGRGNKNFTKYDKYIGIQEASSTLNWGPSRTLNRYNLTSFQSDKATGYHKDFHKFQCHWTTDEITFSVDDNMIGVVIPPDGGFWELGKFENSGLDNPWKYGTKMAPFDQEFYLIINLAVGGTSYFSDYAVNKPRAKPWSNQSKKPTKEFWEAKEQWLPTWNRATEDSCLQIDYIRVWAL